MPKPELTKLLIAKTLKELMLNIPLNKISIQDIVDTCGLNRKTFYYHFQDKQALICWIFDNEFSALTDSNQNNTIIDELLGLLYENKDFYVAALTSDTQNNLRDHFLKIVYNMIIANIFTMLKNRNMSPQFIELIGNYFSNAIVGSITQWAREGMATSPNEHDISFYSITQGCLEFVINKYFGTIS